MSISSLYLHSRSQAKPLRIGVLVDRFRITKAARQVLLDVQASDFARLELVVVNRQPPAAPAPSESRLSRRMRLLRESRFRRLLLYSLYNKLDKRYVQHPDPLEEVDSADILGGIPRLDVIPIAKRFVHRFPPEAIAAVRSHDLDVLLRFGFNILHGEVLTSARYGVWSFHHGDNDFYRGGPALFWEVVEDNPCSGVLLQVLDEQLDAGQVLCKSVFSTVRGLSRNRNVFYPYWGSSHFVIRKLHELHECGWESVKQHAVPPAPYRGKVKVYRAPGNSQMLKWIVPAIGRKLITRPFRRDTRYHWRICLRHADSSRLLTGRAGPLARGPEHPWLPSPAGHFYADPFLLEHQGQLWLFFEDYRYDENRGRIACAPIESDLSIGPARTCLDLPYHVSYPFVFHHGSDVFLIPESASNESVDLYRATAFPFSWKLERTLFRGCAVDTTPILHDDRWYFFTTLCEPPHNAVFGTLFSAAQLSGDWVLHPNSPISTDVRNARSAGRIQRLDGRLFRPVQDCSERYGRRIHVQEILELTPSTCRERRLHSIEPDWEKDLKGTHTYDFSAGIEALDAVTAQDRRLVAPAP